MSFNKTLHFYPHYDHFINNLKTQMNMKKNYIKQMFALLLVTLFAGQVNAQDEVVFNFNELDVATSENVDNVATEDGNLTEPYVWTIDGVTLTISLGEEDKTPNRWWKTNNGPQLRCYSGTITISATSNFSKIDFDATSNFNLTADKGTLTGKTWTHEGTDEVVFTVSKNTQINFITVTMGDGETVDIDAVDKTIADLANETEAIDYVKLNLNNAKVVYSYTTSSGNANVFVREGDNAINFYSTGLDLPLNATLNGSVIVKFSLYSSMPQVGITTATNADDLTITAATTDELDPIVVSIQDILDAKYKNHLVEFDDVTIIAEPNASGTQTNYFAEDASGARIQLYGNNNAVKNYADQTVDVIGVFNTIYQGTTPEVRPVEVIEGGDTPEPQPGENEVADIEAFKKLDKGTEATLKLNNALVLYATATDVFVHDQSGAIDFYQTGIEFEAGQVLNGSIYGQFDIFRSLPELKAVDGKTNADDITFTTGSVSPLTGIDLGEAAAYACELVTVRLTVSKEGNNFYGEDEDGNKLQIYDKFHIGYNTADIEGKTFDITGIIIPYNSDFEIAPTEDFVGAPDETCANIAEFKALEKGATAVLTLTDAQVLYNGGNDIYVKDASGAIDFYKTNIELKAGDVLNGTIKAQYTEYNGTPELTAVVENNLDITTGSPVAPESMDARTAALEENICNLVRIADVTPYYEQTTNDDGTKTYDNWYDSSNKFVQIYDKWKIGYTLEEGNTYTFTGIMIVYNEQPELYVTVDPTNAGATAISEVNAEQSLNAPIYNMAGQRVSNAVKGVFIQNGKKYVVK